MSKKDKSIQVKLIVNPGAGKAANAAKNLELVMGCLEKNGLKVNVAYARPKEAATTIARRAVKAGYKIVIAMGGDGTIEAVMRGMVGSKAHLGIIPVGTMNNVALSLGIPKDLEEACALIASDTTFKLDVGQLKTRKGKKMIFFEMATIGVSADIYPDADKAAKGKLSSMKDAALTFLHKETNPKFYLTLNDESKISVETMMVLVSNTPYFGSNFLAARQASMQDGLLDVSVYPEFSKVELVGYFAAVMNGGYSGDKKVQHYQARKVKVKTSPKQKVMADGVILGKGTATIKILPGALRMIAPKEGPGVENAPKDTTESSVTEPGSPASANDKHEKTTILVG